MACAPQCAIGMSGMSSARANRTAPVLPRMGHRSGSRVSVPSGYTMTPRPCATRISDAWMVWRAAAAEDERATGTMPVARRAHPSTGTLNRLSFAMKRGARPNRQTARATISGSNSVEWLGARTYGPSRGSFSPSMISTRAMRLRIGTMTAASGQKTLGRRFSSDARNRGEEVATCGLSDDVEVGAQCVELGEELLVAATDDADVAHHGLALGRQRGDQVAVAAAEVRHHDVGAV